MSRILEGVFVLGCSLVGLGIGAPKGSAIQDTVQCSVQLIALAQDNVATNAARLSARLSANLTNERQRVTTLLVAGFAETAAFRAR